MHSANYAIARCLSVRLSVRHTPILCQNGWTYPQTFFIIRQLHYCSMLKTIFMAILPRGVECNGGIIIAVLDQYLAVSRKWYKIRPFTLKCKMQIGNRTQAVEWYGCIFSRPEYLKRKHRAVFLR